MSGLQAGQASFSGLSLSPKAVDFGNLTALAWVSQKGDTDWTVVFTPLDGVTLGDPISVAVTRLSKVPAYANKTVCESSGPSVLFASRVTDGVVLLELGDYTGGSGYELVLVRYDAQAGTITAGDPVALCVSSQDPRSAPNFDVYVGWNFLNYNPTTDTQVQLRGALPVIPTASGRAVIVVADPAESLLITHELALDASALTITQSTWKYWDTPNVTGFPTGSWSNGVRLVAGYRDGWLYSMLATPDGVHLSVVIANLSTGAVRSWCQNNADAPDGYWTPMTGFAYWGDGLGVLMGIGAGVFEDDLPPSGHQEYGTLRVFKVSPRQTSTPGLVSVTSEYLSDGVAFDPDPTADDPTVWATQPYVHSWGTRLNAGPNAEETPTAFGTSPSNGLVAFRIEDLSFTESRLRGVVYDRGGFTAATVEDPLIASAFTNYAWTVTVTRDHVYFLNSSADGATVFFMAMERQLPTSTLRAGARYANGYFT